MLRDSGVNLQFFSHFVIAKTLLKVLKTKQCDKGSTKRKLLRSVITFCSKTSPLWWSKVFESSFGIYLLNSEIILLKLIAFLIKISLLYYGDWLVSMWFGILPGVLSNRLYSFNLGSSHRKVSFYFHNFCDVILLVF